MAFCLICLENTRGEEEYHSRCIERLFGTRRLPHLDVELGELYALAAKMAGKMSISGVQEKLSLKLSSDGERLEVAETGGRYILKPEPVRYAALPQNEHVTMHLASLVEVETPPFGLVRLKGGTLAYLIKRFDRLEDGTKLQVEDFCQLAGIPAKDKYEKGSAELCVRLLKKYASEPLIEARKLYRLLLFGWWVANGDMHMKNFSLLTEPDGTRRLSPAYDLVNTRLFFPDDDSTAMMMQGRKKKLTRRNWIDFAAYCGIPKKAAVTLLTAQIDALEPAIGLIQHSFLPEKARDEYERIVRANTAVLKGETPTPPEEKPADTQTT
jgi:serine/threonine-protein kinase HipA